MKNQVFEESIRAKQALIDRFNAAKEAGDEEELQATREAMQAWGEEYRKVHDEEYQEMFNLAWEAHRVGNDLIDLNRCIWEKEIPALVEKFRKYGIDAFTISSGYSSLNETIYAFLQNGCRMDGMVITHLPYQDFMSDEFKTGPAFLLRID